MSAQPQEPAAPPSPAPAAPQQGTPVRTWMNRLSKATLRTPNSYMPSWTTGALPHALLLAGGGAIAGKYGIPWALRRILGDGLDEERVNKVSPYLGALAGTMLAAPNLYTSFQAARSKSNHPQTGETVRGPWSGGLKGLFSGPRNFRDNKQQIRDAQTAVANSNVEAERARGGQ